MESQTLPAPRPGLFALFLRTLTWVDDDDAWLDRAAWPFPARFLPVEGGRMHYVDVGEGAPVVFVHGTPTWSFLWRAAVADLSRDHRCIAMDHVGFGLSDKPADLTPAEHSANLERLLDHLDLREVTLVVHDFGGPIGLGWATRHPDRVARIVVVNSWLWADPAAARVSSFVRGPLGRFLFLQRNVSPRRLVPMAVAKGFRLAEAVHRAYVLPFGAAGSRQGPWRLGVELAGSGAWYEELWARRATLARTPMHFLWGMKDPTFSPAHLARWTEAFPHAAVTRFATAGHFPQEEVPDAFVGALRGCV